MEGCLQVSQTLRILTIAFIFHKKYLHKVIATGKLSLCAKYDFHCYIPAGNDTILGRNVFFALPYFSIFFPYKALYPCVFTLLKEGYCSRFTLALTNSSPNIKIFLVDLNSFQLLYCTNVSEVV